MSIRGVTFDNQQVTASDHGALFNQIFPSDGILIGCAITGSGSTISIAAGYLVVAGRLIQNTAAASLTASSGGNYVRLLANIDTSLTATTSEFNQVSFSLDYAATLSGFPALTQDDINAGSGNNYQAALAIFALSGSTIGAIASGPNYATVSAQYALTAGNAATATALASARNFTIADNDGSHTGPATAFKGIAAALLKLPATIKATIIGNVTGNLTGNVTGNVSGTSGACTGNAATATTAAKVAHTLTLGAQSHTGGVKTFDGNADVSFGAGNIFWLSAITTDSSTDKPSTWGALGPGIMYVSPSTFPNLSTYGVLLNVFVNSATIRQLVCAGNGAVYYRMGNYAESGTDTWSAWVQLANTSDIPAASTTAPSMDGTASYGSGTSYARSNHVHPTDTSRAPLASPTFTGTPKAPTAAAGTNTTQIATTAFVKTAVPAASSTTPKMDGTAAVGTGTTWARADHVHPTDTTRAAASAIPAATTTTPKMDGTAAVGTNTTWAKGDHVHPTDTSRAALASPTFTGTPMAPTAATSTNNTQIATTAFVKAVIAALTASQIPELPASKVTSGTFAADRIPALSGSKMTQANTTLASFSGRRIYISQDAPTTSQGSIGDIWIQY